MNRNKKGKIWILLLAVLCILFSSFDHGAATVNGKETESPVSGSDEPDIGINETVFSDESETPQDKSADVSGQLADGTSVGIRWEEGTEMEQVVRIEARLLEEADDEYQSCLQKAETYMADAESGKTIVDARLIEIRLLDENGGEIQPETPVTVNVKLADSLPCSEDNPVHILHYRDHDDPEKIEEIAADSIVQDQNETTSEITFAADSFSIYGIVATEDTSKTKITRRTYTFRNDDGSEYIFPLSLAEGITGTDTQTVKNGDILEDVGIPEAKTVDHQGKTFTGWRVTALSPDIAGLAPGDIITLPQTVSGIVQDDSDETVTLTACFLTVNVRFHNGDGSVLRTAQAEPGSVLNLGSYYADTNVIRDGRTMTFFGWSTDAVSDDVLDHSYTVPEQDVDLYPVYRYGYWLNFNKNDEDGDPSEASYTESVFVGNAEVEESDQPADPARPGYTFGGWYYDSACVNAFEFNHTTLNGNTMVYAKWNPAETTYTVVFWLEDADDDGYAYAGEITKDGTSGEVTDYQVVEGDLPEAISLIRSYLQLNRGTNPIVQQRIDGNGSTIVNVYYDRREYKLRFYYAYAESRFGSSVTYHVHTETSSYSNAAGTDAQALYAQAGTRESEISRIPEPSGYSDTGSTEFRKGYTNYTYYYFDIQAKYGENIEGVWPAAPFDFTFTHNRSSYSFISWASRNGSGYYASHDNKNIKGIYSVLDGSLIMDPDGEIAQSFLAYWNSPTIYHYQIYYSLLDGEAADILYNGTGYKLQNTCEVGSTAVWSQQNALTFEGVTAVSDTPVTHSGQTNSMGGNVGFAYRRNTHSITFMTPDGNRIAVDRDIPYGEDLSSENVIARHREDAAALAPEWSTFADWYDNQQGNGTAFSFTGTMPDHDIILYAKYEKNSWTVTFEPNGGTFTQGQENTAKVENGGNISDQETTLNQTRREGYELVGWFKEGGDTPYNFRDPVTSDLTLEAHWRQAGNYYVRYVDTNEAGFITETLLTDEKIYVDQSEVVAASWPEGKSVPDGKEFIGWQTMLSGQEQPDTPALYRTGEKLVLHAEDTMEVTENGETRNYHTMKAVYNTLGTTYIQYDANQGIGTLTDLGEGVNDNIQKDIPLNSDVRLSTGAGFSRKGYELAGWNTDPEADGTDAYAATRYQPGGTYGADDENGNTLYAEWRIVITIRKVDRHDRSLSGAVFQLTTEDGRSNASAAGGIADGSITIGDDGTAVITGLPAGTYLLRETKAPDGFLALGSTAIITVTSDGMSVRAVTLDNSPSSQIRLDTEDGFVITITNRSGTPLPDAGASGEMMVSRNYLLILLLISAAAGIWTYYRNTGGQRKNES